MGKLETSFGSKVESFLRSFIDNQLQIMMNKVEIFIGIIAFQIFLASSLACHIDMYKGGLRSIKRTLRDDGRKIIGEPREGVLLRGELVRQGSNKQDVLGASRHSDQNNPLDSIEEVQGTEIAKDEIQKIEPRATLDVGKEIKTFQSLPTDSAMSRLLGPNGFKDLKVSKGHVLADNIETSRYISNPTETLAELKAKGQSIPQVHGRIIAGDPAELIMISIAASAEAKAHALGCTCSGWCRNRCGHPLCRNCRRSTETSDNKDGPTVSQGSPTIVQPSETPKQENSLKCHVNEKGGEPKEVTCQPPNDNTVTTLIGKVL